MDNNDKSVIQRKLDLLKDETVIQIVFDALHRRREKYSVADNSGQHSDYVDIVSEMAKDYRNHLNK